MEFLCDFFRNLNIHFFHDSINRKSTYILHKQIKILLIFLDFLISTSTRAPMNVSQLLEADVDMD